jgi:hypothetical protein
MITIEWIRQQVIGSSYFYSLHADRERRNDKLSIQEIESILLNGKILEYYPDDRRGESCLIGGFSEEKPIHVVLGMTKASKLVIITVYVPASDKWRGFMERVEK